MGKSTAISARTALPWLVPLALVTIFATGAGAQFKLVLRDLLTGEDAFIANRDFVNYWMGARQFVFGDFMQLFSQTSHQAALEATFGTKMEIRAWSYPPHLIPLLTPLAFFPYPFAYAVFFAGGAALFALSAHIYITHHYGSDAARGGIASMMVPFALSTLMLGQNGLYTSGLMLLGLALYRSRPLLAGLAFAVLTTKPHLGLLVPLLLLIEREYRVVGWTALFSAALIALSLATVGLEGWRAFFAEVLPYQQYVVESWTGAFLGMMPTTFGTARAFGLPFDAAIAGHMCVAALALAVGSVAMWKVKTQRDRHLLFLVLSFVVLPYGFNYDIGALSLALAARIMLSERALPGAFFFGIGVLIILPMLLPASTMIPQLLALSESAMTELLTALPVLLILGLFCVLAAQAIRVPSSRAAQPA